MKLFSKFYKQLLSSHLVTRILCAEYFNIFSKMSATHSFTAEIGSSGCMYTEEQAGITSLYISQLKGSKKQMKTLSISTLSVVKSQSVD